MAVGFGFATGPVPGATLEAPGEVVEAVELGGTPEAVELEVAPTLDPDATTGVGVVPCMPVASEPEGTTGCEDRLGVP